MTEKVKAMSGIQKLLDQVDWKQIKADPAVVNNKDGLSYPTHEGILKIANFEFRVYQLNTGERIINEEDIIKFFTPPELN